MLGSITALHNIRWAHHNPGWLQTFACLAKVVVPLLYLGMLQALLTGTVHPVTWPNEWWRTNLIPWAIIHMAIHELCALQCNDQRTWSFTTWCSIWPSNLTNILICAYNFSCSTSTCMKGYLLTSTIMITSNSIAPTLHIWPVLSKWAISIVRL